MEEWTYDKFCDDYNCHLYFENFRIYFNLDFKEGKADICVAISEIREKEVIPGDYFNLLRTTSLKKEEIETLISDIEKEIKEKNINSFKEACILVLNKLIIN